MEWPSGRFVNIQMVTHHNANLHRNLTLYPQEQLEGRIGNEVCLQLDVELERRMVEVAGVTQGRRHPGQRKPADRAYQPDVEASVVELRAVADPLAAAVLRSVADRDERRVALGDDPVELEPEPARGEPHQFERDRDVVAARSTGAPQPVGPFVDR